MWGHFIGIAMCIVLIVGGLSGKLVLRGTQSSAGLVVVGALWLVYDIYRLVRDRKARQAAEEARSMAAQSAGQEKQDAEPPAE